MLGENPRKIDPLDERLLDDTGLKIWSQLRKELALFYRVIFYSFELGEKFDNLKEFINARNASL